MELKLLFRNVRSHTGKGYYTRKATFGTRPDSIDIGTNKRLNWWCTTRNGLNDLVADNSNYKCEDYPILVLGKTWLGVDKDGRPCWGKSIPKFLDNMLRGRQIWLPTVDVVSCLGADDHSYFVQFADGKAEWVGLPSSLEEDIMKAKCSVRAIALGSNDSYYCLREYGRSCWKGIPEILHDILELYDDVSHVNFGSNEEYFVLFEHDGWDVGGCTLSCYRAIDQIDDKGGEIYDIQFGHDDSWLILYSE